MAVSTFSAIIDFAVKGEEAAIEFLSSAIQSAPEAEKEALSGLKTEAEKNLKTLREILRNSVTEMVMEPCEAIDETKYLPNFSGGPAGIPLRALETQRDFLRAAAKAVNMAEVTRAFERMAAKKDRFISELGR